MGREFELKFRVEEAGFAALREAFPDLKPIRMESTYYDTSRRELGRRRWTLRRRMENGISVCTLKTPLPDGSRGEWEVVCPDIRQGILELCKLSGSTALKDLTDGDLQEVCSARFTRLAGTFAVEGGLVELALDRGILTGGAKTCDLLEVEVELKEGSDEAARNFAGALAEQYGLVPESRSKYARALALADEKQE